MKTIRFSPLSRVFLILSAVLLTISLFVPLWRIDLDAPQYPEGLRLFIHADKLAGNVDIINGLNHYIGMKTLHAEEFVEFTVLPYIIGFYALLSLVTAIAGKKKLLYTLFILFVIFGVVAMVDFWRWEYDYGHNLDPKAAIIVPGMAYQPPLIGFKQLLNFGAYSVPSTGGWCFIASGLLMLTSVLLEKNAFNRFRRGKKHIAVAAILLTFASCGNKQPEAIKLNTDRCDFCKMTISDAKFAAELITAKGRVYKFDDITCMQNYTAENNNVADSRQYVCDYQVPDSLIEAGKAVYIRSENLNSPMGGNIAAFGNIDSAATHSERLAGTVLSWNELKN